MKTADFFYGELNKVFSGAAAEVRNRLDECVAESGQALYAHDKHSAFGSLIVELDSDSGGGKAQFEVDAVYIDGSGGVSLTGKVLGTDTLCDVSWEEVERMSMLKVLAAMDSNLGSKADGKRGGAASSAGKIRASISMATGISDTNRKAMLQFIHDAVNKEGGVLFLNKRSVPLDECIDPNDEDVVRSVYVEGNPLFGDKMFVRAAGGTYNLRCFDDDFIYRLFDAVACEYGEA